MIAVIADDLTGAAEIGGIALRHGLRVVMDTKVHRHDKIDVMIVATDARSKNEKEAQDLIFQVTKELINLRPDFIFKKTDSLLRGNVAEELLAQMHASGKNKVLLIPANPALKRTIKNGIYYSQNIPLNESDLADASRRKIATSCVLDLIGDKYKSITKILSLGDKIPENGLIIGNTATEKDLECWAKVIDNDTIPAGSGGFFNAFLKCIASVANQEKNEELIVGKKIIYVCGSAFPLSKASVKEAHTLGRVVSYLPKDIFCPGVNETKMIENWASEIIKGLDEKGNVIVAVDGLECNTIPDISNKIREHMAGVIEKVMLTVQVNELVIEGGATASSIIDKLHYERFFPKQELAHGVLRMSVQENENLFLTMKPGSYQWPSAIWNQPDYSYN